MTSKGQLTRQEIVEKAAPLFNQRGYAGASLNDIMQATGLEKGGIYRHFSSKQELAMEAFRYALQLAVDRRLGTPVPDDDAGSILRSMIRCFLDSPSPIAGGCPLMNLAIDADDTNPALRSLAREGISAWKTRIVSVVEGGMRKGEISPGTSPPRLANVIVATLEGALMISRLEHSRAALEDARAALFDLVAHAELPR